MVWFPLYEIWDKRFILYHMSLIEIKNRYKGTYLGLLWAALEPFFYFIVLYLVFTAIREVPKENFAVYLITGVMFFHLFVKGTTMSITILGRNPVLTSLNIKKEFFPVLSTSVTFWLTLVELMIVFVLMIIVGFVPPWTIIYTPLLIILFLSLILGISYFISILFVFIRDVNPIWNVLSHSLIFISPIFWYVDEVKGTILFEIQKINPLGQIIELAHKLLVFGEIPTNDEWISTTIFVAGILFLGFLFFKLFENKVMEKI